MLYSFRDSMDNLTMTSITQADNIGVIERSLMALEMRRNGYDYVTIAKVLAVSPNTASKYVRDALLQFVSEIAETTEEVRQLELARLDKMQASLEEKLGQGQLGAINTALRIMERREKLLGLEKPVPQERRETRITIEYKNDWRTPPQRVIEGRVIDDGQNLIAEAASGASDGNATPSAVQVSECWAAVAEDDAGDEHSD